MPNSHKVQVIARSSPFRSERNSAAFDFGLTLSEIVERMCHIPGIRECCRVFLNGLPVPAEHWDRVKPRAGTQVYVVADIPAIGQNQVREALSVLTSVGGVALEGMIGGPAGAIAGAALSMAGIWLWTNLIPYVPPKKGLPTYNLASDYRNALQLYAPVPYVCGKMRLKPLLASRPFTSVEGTTQWLNMLFVLGHINPACSPKHWGISSMKIGQDAAADVYNPATGLQTAGLLGHGDLQYEQFTSDELMAGITPSVFKNSVTETAVNEELDYIPYNVSSDSYNIVNGNQVQYKDGPWPIILGNGRYLISYYRPLLSGDSNLHAEYFDADGSTDTFTLSYDVRPSSGITVVNWLNFKGENDWVMHTTESPAQTISVELYWPQGLCYVQNSNQPQQAMVKFMLEYRIAGTNQWSEILVPTTVEQLQVSSGGGSTITLDKHPVSAVKKILDLQNPLGIPMVPGTDYTVDYATGTLTRIGGNWMKRVATDGTSNVTVEVIEVSSDFKRLELSNMPTVHPQVTLLVMLQPRNVGYVGFIEPPLNVQVNWLPSLLSPTSANITHRDGTDFNGAVYLVFYYTLTGSESGLPRYLITYETNALISFVDELTQASIKAWFPTIYTHIDGLNVGIGTFAESDRKAMADYKTWLQTIIPLLKAKTARLALEYPNGIDSGVASDIGDGLDTLLGFVENYHELDGDDPHPDQSPITSQNDLTGWLLSMLQVCLDIMRIHESNPDNARTALLAKAESWATIQHNFDPANFGAWLLDNETWEMRGSTTNVVYWDHALDVLTANYDVRARRVSETPSDNGQNGVTYYDQTMWRALRSASNTPSVQQKGLLLLGMKVKASSKNNGSIQEVSAIIQPSYPVWWHREQIAGGIAALQLTWWTVAFTTYGDSVTNEIVIESIYDLSSETPDVPITSSEYSYNAATGQVTTTGTWGTGPFIVEYHGWVYRPTRIAAWHYLDVLIGPSNYHPAQSSLPVCGINWVRDRVNMPRLVEWAKLCERWTNPSGDSAPWHCDMVVSQDSTVFDTLKAIAHSSYATFGTVDGRYGVVMDVDQSNNPPVQMFTPRNTRTMTMQTALIDRPDALRIQFKNEDPAVGYEQDEVMVYDDKHNGDGTDQEEVDLIASDGSQTELHLYYPPVVSITSIMDPDGTPMTVGDFTLHQPDVDTAYLTWASGAFSPVGEWTVTYQATKVAAAKFETIQIDGIVNVNQAWSYGRYLMACAIDRPRKYTVTMDYEHCVAERGDLVLAQHWVMLTGVGAACRCVSVTADTLTVDNGFTVEAGKLYGFRARYSDGWICIIPVIATADDDVTVFTLPNPTSDHGVNLMPGDLMAFGEIGSDTRELVITNISGGANMEGTIELCDHAPSVFRADRQSIPPFDPRVTIPPPTQQHVPPTPVIADVITDERALLHNGDTWTPRIEILLEPPPLSDDVEARPKYIEYQYRPSDPTGHDLDWNDHAPIGVTQAFFISGVMQGNLYDVRVRYRTDDSWVSDWAEAYMILVLGTSGLPPDITVFTIDDRHILQWEYNYPDFTAGFRIKTFFGYGNESEQWTVLDSLTGGLITEHSFDVSQWYTNSTQTFLIKAVDIFGNESMYPGVLVANLGDESLGNIVLQTDYHSEGFPGWRDHCSVDGGTGDLIADSAGGGLFTGLQYAFAFTPDPYSDGARLTINYTLSGLDANETVRFFYDDGLGSFWNDANPDPLFWNEGIDPFFWIREWKEFPGALTIDVNDRYAFLMVVSNATLTSFSSQVRVTALTVTSDVADVVQKFQDLAITVPVDGCVIPVSSAFHRILYVTLTLQDEGTGALGMRVSKIGVPAHYPCPPEAAGPTVYAYDATGAQTAASFDALVRGY